MFMKIKPFLLLAWSLSLVEANYFTDIVGYTETPETGKEIDYNFGSLRMAVMIHADDSQKCGDEALFSEEFYDGLTHAISLAIDVEQVDSPDGDDHRHIFFPPKLWKDILHREKKHVNAGLIWEHNRGKHKKMTRRDRDLLFGYGATEPPQMEKALDPFCHHIHAAAPRDRFVECSCTGDYCHETVAQRRKLGRPHEVQEDELELVFVPEPQADQEHEAEQGHRELVKERSRILNIFEQSYNIPLLSFSWMGHKAAVDYIKEVLADREITPACFSMDKDPIVVIGMTLFYTKE